jgi:hypothetical protein
MIRMSTRALALGAALAVFIATPALCAALRAELNGANERPVPGEVNGRGTIVMVPDLAKMEICYRMTVENVPGVNKAYIHKGGAGVAGQWLVVLSFPSGPTGATNVCMPALVSPAVLQDIVANPGGYYVNVSSTAFPGGAVRGQLHN